MLGEILQGLTDADAAEAMLADVGSPELRQRIERVAAAGNLPVGRVVAQKVRHLLDHGGEDIWLELLGAMSGTPHPGAVAVDRILARAFPAERRDHQASRSTP